MSQALATGLVYFANCVTHEGKSGLWSPQVCRDKGRTVGDMQCDGYFHVTTWVGHSIYI